MGKGEDSKVGGKERKELKKGTEAKIGNGAFASVERKKGWERGKISDIIYTCRFPCMNVTVTYFIY